MEFLKSNIGPEWMDLVEEFPEFILDLSPEVKSWVEKYQSSGETLHLSDCCNLRYGFECGIGWKEIIREYFTNIKNLLQKARENGDEVFYKTCIFKEKFGELRDQGDFYGNASKKYWEDYVKLHNDLMNKSAITCELCGESGQLRKRGYWVKTLCDTHSKDNGYTKY